MQMLKLGIVGAGFVATFHVRALMQVRGIEVAGITSRTAASAQALSAMVVREPYAEAVNAISASTSYGGNPMACAAALASIEAIEEEGLLEHAGELEALFARRMADWPEKHPIVGDTRVKGCLLGVELVVDQDTKEPFDEAGKLVYQAAFRKGLAWIPAGHILRMSPSIVMPERVAQRGMDIIEESIAEVEKTLGY